jgi:predicted secreted protein
MSVVGPATPVSVPAGGGCGINPPGPAKAGFAGGRRPSDQERIIMLSTIKARQEPVPIVDIKQHRKTIDLHCGDCFLVRLSEDPDMGYEWRANKAHGLVFVDNWFAPAVQSRLMAGGLHYWRLQATSAGRHFFIAIYQGRDKESLFPPIIFQFQVNVMPD